MVTVVNKSQQVVAAGSNPKSEYSRNIVLQLRAREIAGGEDFACTRNIGNNVWLLGVKVYFMPVHPAMLIHGVCVLSYGFNEAKSIVEVSDKWSKLVDEHRLVGQYMFYHGGFGCWEFKMKRLFKGKKIILGCAIMIVAPGHDFWVMVVYEISEG